jgi:2-polyprenyl-6-methoxyphenol hydroxylase-like FAD-dependent oxidoreductase
MNTAIADGHDLGSKLGWVLKGWAAQDLLATYETERRPVASHNVERSVDERGSYRDTLDEIHVDLGGRDNQDSRDSARSRLPEAPHPLTPRTRRRAER